MNKKQTFPRARNRELGAVAVVVAFAWTALFGMAVLAVDFGYLYAKRRGVQAAADVALRASMPGWVSSYPNGYSAASNTARTVANANGFSSSYGDTVTTTEDVPGNLFTVSITRTFPTFIGGVFGYSGKTVTAKATGQRNPTATGAAIHADGNNACPGAATWGLGFYPNGNATLIINGDVESNTQVYLGADLGGSVTGAVKTPCGPLGVTFNPYAYPLGSETTAGAPYPDPVNIALAALDAKCSAGTSVFTAVGSALLTNPATWTNTGGAAGCDSLPDEVYCSSADLTIAPITSMSICAGTKATFISAQRVIVGANNSINLAPSSKATGVASNLTVAAYSNQGNAICAGGAADMGSAGTYNLTGIVYVPNGCVWFAGAGGTGGFTMTGQLVGRHIALGMAAGSTFTFNGSGGGAGGTWTLYR